MPRIRTIKPEFWTDNKVGALSPRARLLFLCTFNLADDAGRLLWNDAYLKANAFMYDVEIFPEDSEKIRRELEDAGMVAPYTVRGTTYAEIVNFAKHQSISHKAASRLPDPGQSDLTGEDPPESSGEIRNPPEKSPRNREQGTGNMIHSPSGSDARTRAPARTREAPPDVATTGPGTVHGSITAADVVAAWVDATNANGVSPTSRSKGMVAKEAKSLLDSGNEPDAVLRAAVDAGVKGFPNLERELMAMLGRPIPKRIANKPSRDDKVRELLELAQREENRNG